MSLTYVHGSTTDFMVKSDGGYRVTVSGLSMPTGIYRIHVGPAQDDSDPVLYSGIPVQADKISVENDVFVGVTPPLPIGGPYAFYFELLEGVGATTFLTPEILLSVATDFRSGTLELRSQLSTLARTGPRRTRDIPYPQE
jgi:hypothetical protein